MVSIAKNASIFDGMVQESKESVAKWVATNAERIDLVVKVILKMSEIVT